MSWRVATVLQLAAGPAHTRSTSRVPNSPYGRTSSTSSITTYGVTTEKLPPSQGASLW